MVEEYKPSIYVKLAHAIPRIGGSTKGVSAGGSEAFSLSLAYAEVSSYFCRICFSQPIIS